MPNERFYIVESELEGIRDAFTAEMLRAIGSDDPIRFVELLDSGFDINSDIGDKNIGIWCSEMEATECRRVFDEYHSRESHASNCNEDQVENDNETSNKIISNPCVQNQEKDT